MNDEDREYFEYLDKLRSSGETNMLAAPTYLRREFGMEAEESNDVFWRWADSFSERHPQ